MEVFKVANLPNDRSKHAAHKPQKSKFKSSGQKETFDALLSITSAAVDALEKPKAPQRTDSVSVPTSSRKQGSVSAGVSSLSTHDLRADEYRSKKQNQKADTGQDRSVISPDNVSVESKSSTASEILVRTTSADRPDRTPTEALNLSNTSKHSQSSQYSVASSTFITGGAKRVKVSSKNLKEIKSPFEESTERTLTNTGNMGFFQMLDNSSLLKSPERQKENLAPDIASEENVHLSINNKNQSVLNEDLGDVSDRSVNLKTSYSDSQCGRKISDVSVNVVKHHSVRKHTTEHRHSVLIERHNTETNTSQLNETVRSSESNTEFNKASREFTSALDSGYQTKQLSTKTLYGTQPLNDFKRPSSSQANTSAGLEGLETGSNSSCTQPEIYDVPETIITVNAQNGVQMSSSTDSSKLEFPDSVDRVDLFGSHGSGNSLEDRFLKYHVPLLKQGALSETMGSKQTAGDCIVTKLNSTQKQQLGKKELANRCQKGAAKKKIVQPQLVQVVRSDTGAQVETSQKVDPVTTAAVAASAVVAATQPFLQAQHQMESKMSQVLEKLAVLQEESRKEAAPTMPTDKLEKHNGPTTEVRQLENQLKDLTQKRLDYLEKMQEQQMTVQAQLLSISRQKATPSHGQSPASKVSRPPSAKHVQYNEVHSSAATDKLLNNKDTMLETPAPRRKPPVPVAYQAEPVKSTTLTPSLDNGLRRDRPQSGQLLKEILSSRDETPQKGPFPNTPPSYRDEVSHHTAVRHAGELVNELSDLKTQMKHVLSDASRLNEYHHPEPIRTQEDLVSVKLSGPAPLDAYLTRPEDLPSYIPYPKMPQAGNAPVVANYSDAEATLKDVQRTRANLEANLDLIIRSKGELDVYSLIDELAKEGLQSERIRIMKMVDAQIARMGPQMQKEILADILRMEEKEQFRKEMMERLVPERDTNVPHQAAGKSDPKNTNRPVVAQTRTTGLRNKNSGVESRINTGLKKSVSQKDSAPGKATKFRKPVSSVYPSETYMNRVYGKTLGQPTRSTQRNSQLRQTTVAAKHSPITHRGVEKTKTAKVPPVTSQYYFDPSSQTLANGMSAPVHGQLVPMAIPLGAPRQQGSAPPPQYVPTTPQVNKSHIVTSTPLAQSSPDRAKTGLVTVKETRDEKRLTTQVLSPVDIDTEPSSVVEDAGTAAADNKYGDNAFKKSAAIPNVQDIPLTNFLNVSANHNDSEHGDNEADSDITAQEEDESHYSEPIALPGYHHPTPAKYHGPIFPPQAPSLRPPSSSELAVDIAAKDSIQHTAMAWVEQELMARILSEIAANRNLQLASVEERQRTTQEKHVHVEVDEMSEVTESSTSSDHDSLLAEAVGQEGLQLFVNAGVPMDETLVNQLIKEVLMEKAGTMIGERTDLSEKTEQAQHAPHPKPRPRSPAKVTTPRAESPIKTSVRSPVPTPEPTPVGSPVQSPRRAVSTPPSPDLTPAVSETADKPQNQLAAYVEDSTEEDITLPPMPVPSEDVPDRPPSSPLASRHDVLTPSVTPREELQRPYTPEVSEEEAPPSPKPQPMPKPTSPERPELQDATTQYQESDEEDESIHEVAVQTTPPPSPVLQEKKISPIVSPESSLSETQMENISEGQWLVSGLSEGEVRAPVQLQGVRGIVAQPPFVGSEPDDTLYEADDLDHKGGSGTVSIDTTETDVDAISEGEFLHRGPVDQNLLAAMAQVSNQPIRVIEQMLQQQNLLPQPTRGILKGRKRDATQSRSAGEIGRTESHSAGQVIQVAGANTKTAKAFSSHLHRQTSHDLESPGEFNHEKPKYPVASPRKRSSGSMGSLSSAEQQSTAEPPAQSIDEDLEATQSESRGLSGSIPREPQMRLTVGGKRTGALSGPIMATDTPSRARRGARGGRGGGRLSMSVSRSFSPPPDTGPTTDHSVDASAPSGGRLIQVGQSLDSEFRDTLDDLRDTRGSLEMGAGGTRTMTPDQMNVDALLQSRDYFNTGTQSDFESTGGALMENTGKSKEFGATGTLRRQGTFNVEDSHDSFEGSNGDAFRMRQSLEYPGDPTSNSSANYKGRNQYQSEDYDDMLGRTGDSFDGRGSMQYPDSLEGTGNYNQYAQTLEDMISQSENDNDAKRKTGPIALSVTIPSMEQSESEVSEFSIGNYSPSHG